MTERFTPQEQLALRNTLLRANEQGWGIAIGLLLGLGLFVATVVLLLKNGDNPGPHLSLLRVYFPGYSVTWMGAAIGFVYAFVAGFAVGRTIAAIYNRLIKPPA